MLHSTWFFRNCVECQAFQLPSLRRRLRSAVFSEFCDLCGVFFGQFAVFWEPLSTQNTQDLKKEQSFLPKKWNMYLSKSFCLPVQKEMDMAWKCGWWWMQVWKKLQVLQVLEALWRDNRGCQQKEELFCKTPLESRFWVELPHITFWNKCTLETFCQNGH